MTDGTSEGTVLLKDIAAGAASSDPGSFSLLASGSAVFTVTNALGGQDLWATNGTQLGTVMLQTLDSSSANYVLAPLALGNGKAVFVNTTPSSGQELWVTDGTPAARLC